MSTVTYANPRLNNAAEWDRIQAAMVRAGFLSPLSGLGEITVTDMFAGAGGSSTGMDQIPGVRVITAANHMQLAMDVHQLNHTDTDHAVVDLHQENPRYFPKSDVLWASPECTKWSQSNSTDLPDIEADLFTDADASNAANQSRLLMFDVLRYIEHHRYRRVLIENVVDIAVSQKYALAWQTWKKDLRKLGYEFHIVSLNSMHAQFGGDPAPQSRDRLYIIAWPKGEVAPDISKVMRPKAYCPTCGTVIASRQAFKPGRTVGRYRQQYVYVDPACGTTVEPAWLPAAAAIDWSLPGERIGDRKTPLADKTRARIAAGIARYWRPVTLEAAGNTYDAADPKHRAHGRADGYYRTWPVDEPLMTLHTSASKALAVPVEGRVGKEAKPVTMPGRTQTCRAETALAVLPFVSELRGGGSVGHLTDDPLSTVTASGNHHALITPAGGTWNDTATSADDPLRTLTTRDAYALLAPYYSGSGVAQSAMDALGTLTTHDRYALVHRHNSGGSEMLTPAMEEMRTLTTAGHQSVLSKPMDMEAADTLVDDCLFRMLQPHEVANGMAFPREYLWQPYDGKVVSNRDLVRMAGNAVTPPAARDLMYAVVESLVGPMTLAA
jgi:DNA (cytosine-5)-methyltransferase 1